MHSSPSCSNDVTVTTSSKSMKIPIQVIIPDHIMKVVDTHALVDSGADVSCIDHHFAKKHRLSLVKLSQPILIQNADLTENKKGMIRHTCHLFISIKGIAHDITFYVMGCGKENLILGLPWLRNINPTINWKTKTLSIMESTNQSKDLYLVHNQDSQQHDTTFPKQLLHSLIRHSMVNVITHQHLYSYLQQEMENQPR